MRYDQGIPRDEDLVELLIDPLRSGSRASRDLYHVVIFRSGGHVLQRGIPLNEAAGGTWAWNAEMQYAIEEEDELWVVEARIPLSAFDAASEFPASWGFNVTRFDPSEEEFSNWSGAGGNPYDPWSLGNLLIP